MQRKLWWLPETPSYTKGETLKAKSEGFQEDHMGWFQKEGLLFLPGNLQWKLVNSLHATTHPPKITRKILQSNRPPDDYKASGLLLSYLPINNPQGAQRPKSCDAPRALMSVAPNLCCDETKN